MATALLQARRVISSYTSTAAISTAMLAIMLGTLKPGERVLSLVAQGRSHPSVQHPDVPLDDAP